MCFVRTLGNISGRNENSTYYLSVCGVVKDLNALPCLAINPNASICQLQTRGGQQYFDIGNHDAQLGFAFTDIARTGVTYNITGTEQWSAQRGQTSCG